MKAPTVAGRICSIFLATSLSLMGTPVQASHQRAVEGPQEAPVEAPSEPAVVGEMPAQVGPPTQPAPPTQLGPPTQLRPAGPPPGYVNMNINTGPGVIEQLMYYPIPGSSDTREEWTFLCQSPCRVSVHPSSRLRVRGGEAEGDFEPIGGQENYVYYRPRNRGARAGGGVMIGLGGISLFAGAGILVASLINLPFDAERAGGLALWSLFPLFGGFGLIGGGIALVVTSRAKLGVGLQPVALVPRKLVLSTRGLHF